MNYIITGKNFTSKILLKLKSKNIKILTEDELTNSKIYFNKEDKVYVPSESSLNIVLKRMKDKKKYQSVVSLKDKYKFRLILKKLFPNFHFKKILLSKLKDIKIDSTKKYIVKPVKGFFGTGIRTIDKNSSLQKISEEIKIELDKNSKIFSESVISKNELLIEEYLEGDEYAVDMYYDDLGKPIIQNIYHHPSPTNIVYFHVLYYTSYSIFNKYLTLFEDFFKQLNKKLSASSIAIHAEFKYDGKKMLPIEFNPLRFGGFGLADLTYHGFNTNPFENYFNNEKPDWNKIWKSRKKQYFGWVLGYNGINVDVINDKPDHNKFKSIFSNVMDYCEIDYKSNPVFAIMYVKETNYDKLMTLLKIDFNKFFY